MLKPVKIFIGNNRNSRALSFVARMSEKYLRSYYNEDYYDFRRNGEAFVLRTFSRWIRRPECCVWDVGANHGQWAREAKHYLPNARITSFEILPHLARQLAEEAGQTDWWRVEQTGVSNRTGQTEVCWNRSSDAASSVSPDLDDILFADAEVEKLLCTVTTLDSHWQAAAIAPDLLKIDTEGHDWAVLEGAETLLSSDRAPAMIQFEYGRTWIGSQRMLGPVQRHLESLGYEVGRLYPNSVDFRPFTPEQEHFRMGNMIAVRDPGLRAMLARR